MLLTDGSPNCNATPQNAVRCDACNEAGTVEACNDLTSEPLGCYPINSPQKAGMGTSCDFVYRSDPSMYGTNCLDKDHTVEAIEALRDAGIETFVIGFGNTAVAHPSSSPPPLRSSLESLAFRRGPKGLRGWGHGGRTSSFATGEGSCAAGDRAGRTSRAG